MDGELATIFPQLQRSNLGDVTLARRQLEETAASAHRPSVSRDAHFYDRRVPGSAGRPDVRARIYVPSTGDPVDQPCAVFLHGGAFVLGNLDTEHERCVHYATRARCLVISVDYRLAPEHPFPAAFDDTMTALHWVASNGKEIGGDANRIALVGVSAGGALAAGAAQAWRDLEGPPIAMQLLVYPVTDDRCSTASMHEFEEMAPWDAAASRQMWSLYLGANRTTPPQYAAPARTTDLSGLPPAYVSAAELDPLRDEAVAYAQRLSASGVATELHQFAGAFHGFDLVAPASAIAVRALDEQADALARGLGTR